ncbi:MAG: hypothetical protein DWQ01_08955 [Planctomycetota bacterium]|nr:MAG: hypothetical protein DWQ01_08955 [Planctomycetota bacterium]
MPRFFRRTRTGFATTFELLRSLWRGPYWWLVPLVVILIPAALFFILLQAMPIVSPFIYSVL